jgi:hypothetical protein
MKTTEVVKFRIKFFAGLAAVMALISFLLFANCGCATFKEGMIKTGEKIEEVGEDIVLGTEVAAEVASGAGKAVEDIGKAVEDAGQKLP